MKAIYPVFNKFEKIIYKILGLVSYKKYTFYVLNRGYINPLTPMTTIKQPVGGEINWNYKINEIPENCDSIFVLFDNGSYCHYNEQWPFAEVIAFAISDNTIKF